jgi:uncharacterized protein YceK
MTGKSPVRGEKQVRRAIAIFFVMCASMSTMGCASMMVVMGDFAPAEAECQRYGYFAATRMDVRGMRNVWADQDVLLPGKVIGTGFMVADLPLSLAFDVLFDAPIKFLHGNPECPWRRRDEFRRGDTHIAVGMTKETVRPELKEAGARRRFPDDFDVWRASIPRPRAAGIEMQADRAVIEIYFSGGIVRQILVHAGTVGIQ